MNELWRDVLIAALGASGLGAIIGALSAWALGRKRLQQEAQQAVAAAWEKLCAEQQEQISLLQKVVQKLRTQLEKMQGLAEQLRDRIVALELENAELRIDLKAKDARISALERENNCLRGAK